MTFLKASTFAVANKRNSEDLMNIRKKEQIIFLYCPRNSICIMFTMKIITGYEAQGRKPLKGFILLLASLIKKSLKEKIKKNKNLKKQSNLQKRTYFIRKYQKWTVEDDLLILN